MQTVELHREGVAYELDPPAAGTLRWTSSDSSVVFVTEDGIAYALRDGEAVLTAVDPAGNAYQLRAVSEIVPWEKLGDGNQDGSVDSKDAMLVLQEYAARIVLEEDYSIDRDRMLLCDVNEDGEIDSVDATYLLNFFARFSLLEVSDDPMVVWLDLFSDFS